jgi:hypothetical protein
MSELDIWQEGETFRQASPHYLEPPAWLVREVEQEGTVVRLVGCLPLQTFEAPPREGAGSIRRRSLNHSSDLDPAPLA